MSIIRKCMQPLTCAAEYLNRLGKSLFWYFPYEQVREILSDYEEYFSAGEERGVSPEKLIEGLGTPGTVVAELRAENTRTKSYLFGWLSVWGSILLILSCLFLHRKAGMPVFLILAPVLLFCLVHGWDRVRLERLYPAKVLCKKGILAIHVFLFLSAVLVDLGMQYLLRNIETLPSFAGVSVTGIVIDRILILFLILSIAVLVGTLMRVEHFSVVSFAGTVHAFGGMLFGIQLRNCLHRMDLTGFHDPKREILFAFSYYIAGLVLTFFVYAFLKFQTKPSKKREG